MSEAKFAQIDEILSQDESKFGHFLDNVNSYNELNIVGLILVGEVNKLLDDFLEGFCGFHLLL